MANEESFLLVSLEGNKAKQLAQVISNDTSRKLLDILSKKDATETEISKLLKIPLSTVHYNLKALVEANLVKVDEYHYSEKGKEVNHYSLTNKLIIIAPKETSSLKDALRKFLPISILVIVGAAIIQLAYTLFQKPIQAAAPMMLAKTADVAQESAPMLAGAAQNTVQATSAVAQIPFSLWFLAGALFVILLYVIFEFVASKRK
jgi:DNA-binding transcriptional ArsR family regulator